MTLQAALDGALKAAAPHLLPFYRRYPYRGPLWLTEVDTRGAISARDRFFFNRVPKAANSTTIAALARASAERAGETVKSAKWYFQRPLHASRHTVARIGPEFFKLTFVRNPYSRTLSAYLDKIVRRAPMSRAFQAWNGGAEPSFAAFCRWLDAGGLHHDIHWAPQTAILLLPVGDFDLIGRFETLEPDLTRAFQRIFGAPPDLRREGPRTDAEGGLAAQYDAASQAIVARLYAADFAAFGYDPAVIG